MVDIGNIGNSIPVVRTSVPVKQEVALPSLAKPSVDVPIDLPINPAPVKEPRVTFADVQAAAQVVASNPYPVSDQRFTIFKDIAGDYVTRFTSLVDGSVKYYPQKTLFEMVQVLKGKISAPTIDTNA